MKKNILFPLLLFLLFSLSVHAEENLCKKGYSEVTLTKGEESRFGEYDAKIIFDGDMHLTAHKSLGKTLSTTIELDSLEKGVPQNLLTTKNGNHGKYYFTLLQTKDVIFPWVIYIKACKI